MEGASCIAIGTPHSSLYLIVPVRTIPLLPIPDPEGRAHATQHTRRSHLPQPTVHSSDTGPAMGSVGLRGVVAPRVEGGGSSLTEGDSRGYVREGFVRSIP